jgi:hypothetical protein
MKFCAQEISNFNLILIDYNSLSAMTSFYLSIDGHMLQVIEVDGTPTTPSDKFHRLPIHVGQRYSIIPIRLPKSKSTNYYLRAEIIKEQFRSTIPYDMSNSIPTELKMIIRYNKENKDISSIPSKSWMSQRSSKFSLIDLNPLDLKSNVQEELIQNLTFYQFDLIIDKSTERKSLKFSHKGFNDIDINNPEYFYGSINSVQRGATIYNPNKSTNVLRQVLEGSIKYFPFYWNAYVFKRRWTINIFLSSKY